MRVEANAYFDSLQSERDVERFELDRGARYARQRALSGSMLWWFPFGMFVAFWLLALPTRLAVSLGAWADLALVAASAVIVNRSLAALLSRPASSDLPESDFPWEATCESCGSSIRFRPGATETRCPFCRAPVLAPSALERARVQRAADRAEEATAEADSAAAESEYRATRENPWPDVILVGLALTGLVVWHLAQATQRHLSHEQVSLLLTVAVAAGGAGPLLARVRAK